MTAATSTTAATSAGQPDPIRVALVEDEALYRDMLAIVLSGNSRLKVVGSFSNGESALESIPGLQPQVVILDVELGGQLNGIQVGLKLRRQFPHLGIVLLTNHDEPEFVASLPPEVISGWSYLLKRSVSDAAALARAIEGAAAGFVVLDPQLVARRRPRAESLLARLTPRQREILGLIAQGFTNAGIAERLVLAEKSVENQVNLLYQQLDVSRQQSSLHPRVKAVLLYLRETQLQPRDEGVARK
jgi:DNA-binding NarL/FixJ family response regulator